MPYLRIAALLLATGLLASCGLDPRLKDPPKVAFSGKPVQMPIAVRALHTYGKFLTAGNKLNINAKCQYTFAGRSGRFVTPTILTLPMTDKEQTIKIQCTYPGRGGKIARGTYTTTTSFDRVYLTGWSKYVSNIEAGGAPWSRLQHNAAIDKRGARVLPTQIIMVLDDPS